MVFNIAAETFRLMRNPSQLHSRSQELLLEMDSTLAFCRISSTRDTIDVWVIQDYDAEIWSFKRRINLSRVKPLSQWEPTVSRFPIMAVLSDGEMMIQFPHMRVLRCDIHGKFLGLCEKRRGPRKQYVDYQALPAGERYYPSTINSLRQEKKMVRLRSLHFS
jgi:hypothetical protein